MPEKRTGIGKRIKLRLDELDKSAAWLTAETGRHGREVSAASISILIKRDSRRTEFLPVLAMALGVTEQWLSSGAGPKLRGDMPRQDHEPPDGALSLPARNLGALFDHLSPAAQRAAWPWLVRMLANSPAMLAIYLPFPADNRRVEDNYGKPGRKKAKSGA